MHAAVAARRAGAGGRNACRASAARTQPRRPVAGLAAAAAAALAHGMDLPEAVREAQEFSQQALRHAYRPGMGLALPDRFFWARGKGDTVE